MGNVLAFLKLSKNQKVLKKAGWVDENGNLTDEGFDVLGNIVLEKYEAEFVELAKEFIKEQKDAVKE